MHSRRPWLAIVAVAVFSISFPLSASAEAVGYERGLPPSFHHSSASTLQPGDLLSVQVVDEPQLSGTYVIAPTGNIDLPMVGQIRAAGRTVVDLTADITSRLERYVVTPRVTIAQVGGSVRLVSILGAVHNPGNYNHQEQGNLLSLLAAAGGPAPGADLARAILIREGESAPVGVIAAEGVRQPMPRDVPLRIGDTVYIPSVAERAVRVIGAVGAPGFVALHGDLSVSLAVLAAGGATESADLRSVQLIRGSERLTLDLRPILRPQSVSSEVEARDLFVHLDDIIIVPQTEAHTVHVIGEVRAPGAHPVAEADRASKAVVLSGGATAEGDLSRTYILREGERLELDLRSLLKPEIAAPSSAPSDQDIRPGDVVVIPPLRPVHVLGAVHQPGPVVSDRARTVTQALFSAGGLLPDADTSSARVVRAGKQFPVDLRPMVDGESVADMVLEPEDALIVPTMPQLVNVVGEVQSPGAFSIIDARTLADLWGLAGGALPAANLRGSLLLRGDVTETVDMRALVEDGAVEHNRSLKPGDTLLVPKIRSEIYVFGEVREAGIQPIHDGDTIIDVIARAGGPTSLARIDRIALVRRVGEGHLLREDSRRIDRPSEVRERPAQERQRPDHRARWDTQRRVPAPARVSRETLEVRRIQEGDRQLHLFDLAEVRDDDPAYLARPGDVIWVPSRDIQRTLFDEMIRSVLIRAPFFLF